MTTFAKRSTPSSPATPGSTRSAAGTSARASAPGPRLLNIDLANAWTRPGYRFSCDDMDEQIIPGVQRLLEAARAKQVPIVYTTTAFCSRFDMGAFPLKTPFEDLMLGTPACEIDDRIPPEDGRRHGDREEEAERLRRHPSRRHPARRRHRHPDLHRRHHGRLRTVIRWKTPSARGSAPSWCASASATACPPRSNGTCSTST